MKTSKRIETTEEMIVTSYILKGEKAVIVLSKCVYVWGTLYDLGVHTYKKKDYKYGTKMITCDYTGRGCYYDGTALGAIDMFRETGEIEALIFIQLKEIYSDRFGITKEAPPCSTDTQE